MSPELSGLADDLFLTTFVQVKESKVIVDFLHYTHAGQPTVTKELLLTLLTPVEMGRDAGDRLVACTRLHKKEHCR